MMANCHITAPSPPVGRPKEGRKGDTTIRTQIYLVRLAGCSVCVFIVVFGKIALKKEAVFLTIIFSLFFPGMFLMVLEWVQPRPEP